MIKNIFMASMVLSFVVSTHVFAADPQDAINVINMQVVETYLKGDGYHPDKVDAVIIHDGDETVTNVAMVNVEKSDPSTTDEIAEQAAPEETAKPEPKISYNENKFNHFLTVTGAKLAADPVVAGSVIKQNEDHKSLTESDAIALDNQWRAGDATLIDTTMDNVLSHRLRRFVEEYHGIFTEIFVMDDKGLNVGQSDKTSDYWQGDEEKFTESYNNGKGAVHVEKPKADDSTGQMQIMASLPVRDYRNGKVIGVIALAINPELIR